MANIRRVQTVVTGVAGSPYYVTGTFTSEDGTASNVISTWHTFVTGGIGTDTPPGAIYQTGPTVDLIDEVTGDLTGRESGTVQTITMSGTAFAAPPTTQSLVRWRTNVFRNGREVIGRTFLPNVRAGDVAASGVMLAARQTQLQTRAAAAINDASTVMLVWSRKSQSSVVISSAEVPTKFAVLRSRRD